MGGSTSKAKKYVADRTGYSGSDAEKAANKVTEEGSEVVEKVKEEGTNAEEAFKRSDIGRKSAEFQQYVMDRAGVKDPRDKTQQALDATTEAVRNKVKQQKPKQGPGGGKTIGQGGVEGLKGGAQMTQGQRSRIRQSKRKLRIAK